MKRLLVLLFALNAVMMSFHVWTFLSLDESVVKASVVSSPQTAFLTRTQDEIDQLKGRLQELLSFPESWYEAFDSSRFGRKQLFLPDARKKTLTSQS